MHSPLYHITILLDLQINPLMRSRILNTPMLQSIASMLDLTDAKTFPGSDTFVLALLLICENLTCNYKTLQILIQPVLSVLVPVLFKKLESESLEIKVMAFKVYTDVLV